MDARPTPVTARFLRTPDAAVHLGCPPARSKSTAAMGPARSTASSADGSSTRSTDLDAWAELGLRRSTSDPGKGVVHPAKRLDGYTPPVRR
jgi:hypothetical protein